MEVLQSAAMECVEEVASRPCLLKLSVHLVAVLQLKQEVWHRRGDPLTLSQVTQLGILLEGREEGSGKDICQVQCVSCTLLFF